jgi:hypothetical protein
MGLRVLILLELLLEGCIGVDYLDDPIVGETIEISPDPIALVTGKTAQAVILFKDQYGLEKVISPVWSTSTTDIATVDEKGLITGKKPGQSFLIAVYSIARDTALITVAADVSAVAKVEVVGMPTNLTIGQSVALTVAVKNVNDNLISGKSVSWQSSNDNVLSVSPDGLVLAKANGTASIVATVDDVSSNPLIFNVGNANRVGLFSKSGGYEASGTCTLGLENSQLILKLESDFKTSFALGTFIYLSNSNTNASTVKSAGLELGQITQNGAHSFDITALNSTVNLDDYKYVIILCKPATVIFGYAELK